MVGPSVDSYKLWQSYQGKKVDFKLFWDHLYSKIYPKSLKKWVLSSYKALQLSWTLGPSNFSYTIKKYRFLSYFFTKTTFLGG